jgi:hypothetical protein
MVFSWLSFFQTFSTTKHTKEHVKNKKGFPLVEEITTAKQGNAEVRPDASCGMYGRASQSGSPFAFKAAGIPEADAPKPHPKCAARGIAMQKKCGSTALGFPLYMTVRARVFHLLNHLSSVEFYRKHRDVFLPYISVCSFFSNSFGGQFAFLL